VFLSTFDVAKKFEDGFQLPVIAAAGANFE
jgi:hypothetical protein